MGRAPCCDKANVKKGPWSPQEDAKLKSYIQQNGIGGNWIALPQKIGLKRCGKSCRLRWLNYLRPNIKHGGFTDEEENIICNLYISIGSRWSIIAAQLPGRTDNDIKNYWNTRLKKKLLANQRKVQEIKMEEHDHETFLVNQTLNNQQFPYWAGPQQLSMPMDQDQLTRLAMKTESPFYKDHYLMTNNNNHDHIYGGETSNFGVEVEACLNNLMGFDGSKSSSTSNSGASSSWEDMTNSMVSTPVSNFDDFHNNYVASFAEY